MTLTHGGTIIFTTTDVDRLEASMEDTTLGDFLVTTLEQTLIDLLARPDLGGMPAQALAAAATLATRADEDHVHDLAEARPHTVRLKVDRLLADTWATHR